MAQISRRGTSRKTASSTAHSAARTATREPSMPTITDPDGRWRSCMDRLPPLAWSGSRRTSGAGYRRHLRYDIGGRRRPGPGSLYLRYRGPSSAERVLRQLYGWAAATHDQNMPASNVLVTPPRG